MSGDEIELIGGPEKREIRVVAYNDAWPVRFQTERDRIASALDGDALRVDHVGSTAVPGLQAKPIIDIDLTVEDPDNESSYLPRLVMVGYQLRVREPGHRMLRTPQRDVQIHVCAKGGDWERRHLLFRDWLRHDERDRQAYGQLKASLARREWPDMNAYAAAKGPLIESITGRAEEWAGTDGWAVGD